MGDEDAEGEPDKEPTPPPKTPRQRAAARPKPARTTPQLLPQPQRLSFLLPAQAALSHPRRLKRRRVQTRSARGLVRRMRLPPLRRRIWLLRRRRVHLSQGRRRLRLILRSAFSLSSCNPYRSPVPCFW